MSAKQRRVDAWRDAVKRSTLPATTRLVALAMADYMDFETLGDCWPGTFRIAGDTGLHQRTVQRAMSDLVTAGWLVELRRGGSTRGGRRTASAYKGNFPPSAKAQVGPTAQRHRSSDGPTAHDGRSGSGPTAESRLTYGTQSPTYGRAPYHPGHNQGQDPAPDAAGPDGPSSGAEGIGLEFFHECGKKKMDRIPQLTMTQYRVAMAALPEEQRAKINQAIQAHIGDQHLFTVGHLNWLSELIDHLFPDEQVYDSSWNRKPEFTELAEVIETLMCATGSCGGDHYYCCQPKARVS